MSLKAMPSESNLGRKTNISSNEQTSSEIPTKRVKTSSFSNQNGTQQSLQLEAQQVTKKEERHSKDTFDVATLGRTILTELALQNDSFGSFVSKSIEKCQTQKEKEFMINLLESEVKNAEIERDWRTWRVPLLPREKLKNLSLALNEDNLQLTRNKNDNLLLSKKQSPKSKQSKRFVNSDSINQLSEENTNGAQNDQKTTKLSRFTAAQVSAPKSRFQSTLEAELARITTFNAQNNPLFHNSIPINVLNDIPIKKREEASPQPQVYKSQEYKPEEMMPESKNDKRQRKGNKKQLWNDSKLSISSPLNVVTSSLQSTKTDINDAPNVVGTCQDLEKKYMRLTDLPNPALIRPKHILEKSLTHVINKFLSGAADHFFVIDQMRSIRHVS